MASDSVPKPSQQPPARGGTHCPGNRRHPKSNNSPKKGGRPVTWVGGGGLSQQAVANKGVPELRRLFLEVFGHPTASNNSTWLRKKLCDPPDESHGRGRNLKVRKRDHGAAIWTTGVSDVPGRKVQQVSDPSTRALGNVPALKPIAVRSRSLLKAEPPSESPASGISASFQFAPDESLPPIVSDTGSARTIEIDLEHPKQSSGCSILKRLQHLACPPLGAAGPPTVEVFWPEGEGGGSWWPAKILKQAGRGRWWQLVHQQLKCSGRKGKVVAAGPPTVEVFWPEGEGGGSWWPAKILKVQLRKGICSVLYCTDEQEDLNVHEILESKQLRLMPTYGNDFRNKRQRVVSDSGSYHGGLSAPGQLKGESQPSAACTAVAGWGTVSLMDQVKVESNVTDAEDEAEEQVLRDLQSILANPVDQDCPADMAQLQEVGNSSQDSGQWPEEFSLSSDLNCAASEPMAFDGLDNSSSFTATSEMLTESDLAQDSELMQPGMAAGLPDIQPAVLVDTGVQTLPPPAGAMVYRPEVDPYTAASIEAQMASVQAAIDMKLAAIKNQQIAQQLQFQMLGIPLACIGLQGLAPQGDAGWAPSASIQALPGNGSPDELSSQIARPPSEQGVVSSVGLCNTIFDMPPSSFPYGS
eukprot:CAMPEP_0117652850 /NCGR_PEP_ID=MMETSP0804-20121206/2857_1 /TAXON_ID=1074897 /ORGANISM="Tetraselmis astigmatica, Strain CCMP880" /LENGTH=638 /DNA_ID=CAMNT_0005458945 /DNA_START=833 /DNA_END=2749 /DNA_ORIENTATION=+